MPARRMALRQSQPPNMCFYSNKCNWSEAFIKELAPTPYKRDFQFVCVDTTPRSQLPEWVKQVPTLFIRGDETPIKTDGEVLNWLYVKKMSDPNRSPKTAEIASSEPEAWNSMEMSGKLSDSYGNLINGSGATVESSSTKNFDFGFLNGNAAVGDRTVQNIGSGSGSRQEGRTKSRKEEMFDKQLSAYQESRNSGLPRMKSRQ